MWTAEDLFFASTSVNSVATATTSVRMAPTKLRLRITGHNAWCFLKIRMTIAGREISIGTDLSSGGCNQDPAHQLDTPGDSTWVMGDAQRDWTIEYPEPFTRRQCRFGNEFYSEPCDLAGISDCDDGVVFRERCFRRFGEAKTWHDARSACLRWGGDLVSMHDQREHSVVSRLVGAMPPDAASQTMHWIGYNDLESEGAWAWSDMSSAPPRACAPGTSLPCKCWVRMPSGCDQALGETQVTLIATL